MPHKPAGLKTRQPMRPLASILFLTVGIVFLYFGGRSACIGIASTFWPTVEGQILSSSVKAEAGKKGGKVFSAAVNYAYVVNGRSFTCDRVRFGSINTASAVFPNQVVERYPAGSSVTVYYSSSNPSSAVLEPGFQSASGIVLGIGIIFGSVGVAAIFLPTSRHEQRRRVLK